MAQQVDINERMRSILIDWLIEVVNVPSAVISDAELSYLNKFVHSSMVVWQFIHAHSDQQVHHKFELREETLFLTVNLIDRFLEKQAVIRKKLQLVGLVAMLLACKYEEISAPLVEDLVLISDKAYTRKEILEMVDSGLIIATINVLLLLVY